MTDKPRHPGLLADLRPKPQPSYAGSVVFIFGRLADAPLQYLFFSKEWADAVLNALGLRGSNTNVLVRGGSLAPIPTALIATYAIGGLRHTYHTLFTASFNFPPSAAIPVALLNCILDTINTLFAVNALVSSPNLVNFGWKQYTGLGLFVLGIAMEIISEEGRKRFKRDRRNEGKVVDTRLWSFVRHPNYLGYTLWRAGISLTTGSLTATALLTSFQVWVFYTQSVPELAGWMARKYGARWAEHTRKVPYALIPGVW
ncbi:hypothetical protein FB45DRAFT_846898 [Roridomyces roridus]|uniref:Steroid 5-alpha reductase C-terminal domain-containing protein n=1 Tax=Roridomyces roridus TaxID=1738132 RepID=A0AAD7B1N0_9AGAR|nr:hypothetical protein FB45DRAFT_846898 [Roridomyces roridus]